MLVVAYIGFGNSVCVYHLPYVADRDFIQVKYIYRREEDRVGDTERESWYPDITFTSDIDQVMKDPEVNLVVVNTPDASMYPIQRWPWRTGRMCCARNPLP